MKDRNALWDIAYKNANNFDKVVFIDYKGQEWDNVYLFPYKGEIVIATPRTTEEPPDELSRVSLDNINFIRDYCSRNTGIWLGIYFGTEYLELKGAIKGYERK